MLQFCAQTFPVSELTSPAGALPATVNILTEGGGSPSFAFLAPGGLPPGAAITGLQISATFSYTGTDRVKVQANTYSLSKGGTRYMSANANGFNVNGPFDGETGANGQSGDLWGGNWKPSDFNSGLVTGTAVLDDQADPGSGNATLTAASVTIYYSIETGDDMDFYRAAQEAGWKVLYAEAMPSLASAAALFPSTQSAAANKASVAGTRMVMFCVRGAAITVTCDGTTPTAGGHGIDYPVGSPYMLALNDDEASAVQAIQSGGTASGWIEYWGLP